MKHFTLSLLALAALGAAPSQAQTQKFMPAHQTVYYYQNGSWVKNLENSFTYDSRGNVTQQDQTSGSNVSRYTYEWSPEDQVTTATFQSSSDNGATFTNSEKVVRTYDQLFPKIIMLSNEDYVWTDGAWKLRSGSRNEVTRDADNNVTSFTESETNDKGGWDLKDRYVNTVDPATKQISSSKAEFASNQGGNTTWYTRRVVRNIVWKETNGQIVDDIQDNVDKLISQGNKPLSITLSNVNGTDTTDFGTITVTYDDNGGYKETTTDVFTKTVSKYTVDDANGSNTLEQIYYSDMDGDGELTDADVYMHTKHVQIYDDKGNLIEDKILHRNDDTGEMEEYVGSKYDITYSTEHPDVPAETIYSDWNSDEKAYQQYQRVTTDQYSALPTTAINNVTVAGNQPDRIYNIQGEVVSGSLESAPHGLYIVIRNGKTIKVMK